jgi:transposase InsO family protein
VANRLGRRFQVEAPNRVWVSDITYIRLQQGWVYLAVFIDLFSRQVVGWALSRSLDHGPVLSVGAGTAAPHTRSGLDDPLRSRRPVCLHWLSALPQPLWLYPEHESKSELLG